MNGIVGKLLPPTGLRTLEYHTITHCPSCLLVISVTCCALGSIVLAKDFISKGKLPFDNVTSHYFFPLHTETGLALEAQVSVGLYVPFWQVVCANSDHLGSVVSVSEIWK